MDQDVLVDALTRHLDAIELYVNAIALLAVGAAWAGIRRSRTIEAFGTKFDRRHAFWALAALYLIGNMLILVLFLRIGDLVTLLDAGHVRKGVTTLATHSWVLNPFSYFGTAVVARFQSGEGYGLLIAAWWLCNASLSTLMDDKRNRSARLLLSLFLVVGLGTMFAIYRVQWSVLESLRLSATDLYGALRATDSQRSVGTGLGIVVGTLIFLAANMLQSHFTTKGESAV